MKKHLFIVFAVLAIFLQSCFTISYYYQIYDIKSTGDGMVSNLVYSDNNVEITYNFWESGGETDFWIENISDKDIYVDLSKCFFIYNNCVNDYFNNSYKSVNYYTAAYYSNEGGYNVYHPATNYTKYEIQDKVLCIPSHSMRKINCPYDINKTLYRDCTLKIYPTYARVWNKSTHSYETPILPSSNFSLSTSPIVFRNIISYYIEKPEQSYRVENEFYVERITNYPELSVIENHTKDKTMCGKEYYRNYSTNRLMDGSRFYYKYVSGSFSSIDGH